MVVVFFFDYVFGMVKLKCICDFFVYGKNVVVGINWYIEYL